MNPDFWNRWAQRRGWEDFTRPYGGPWGRGPHDRPSWEDYTRPYGGPWGHGPHEHHEHHEHHGPHGPHGPGHGPDRHRGGRRRHGAGEGEPARSTTDNENDEAFPSEYITDDEVSAATAAAEAEKKGEKANSPDTMMRDETEDPPEELPDAELPGAELPGADESARPRHHGGRHGSRRGRGGFGRNGFGPHRRGGPRGGSHHHHGGGPPPFGPFGPMFGGMFGGGGPCRRGSRGRGPFDLRGMMAALANYPDAQNLREYLERVAQQEQGGPHDDGRAMTPGSDTDEMDVPITPPLDLFEQPHGWVLHLAVPGAKKENIDVNWDADRSVLSVSGLVYRPGDEEFLKGLIRGERTVGLFAREVPLPPMEKGAEAKEEVDSDAIAARMEDGVLIITVPKVERDWQEVKRVEIE